MAVTAPKDTLAYHLARPLTLHRDMSSVPCAQVAARVRAYMANDPDSDTSPDKVALTFYGMNHTMAEIRKRWALYEPLGHAQVVVDTYYSDMSDAAARAFYYLLLICTRETRHVYPGEKGLEQKVVGKFGQAAWDFNQGIQKLGSDGSYQRFLEHPPELSIGPYVTSLQTIFYQGKFSGGFGGPAWGKIADCLVRFVTGEFNAEMMLDTVWTLAHNNGPIFNKGMLYSYHSHTLRMILDVQRAGMIPELVCDADVGGVAPFVTAKLQFVLGWLKTHFPDTVRPYVDWYLVEALGAVGTYAANKKAQVAKWGPPVSQEKALAAAAAAEKAAQQAALAAKKKQHETVFEVMPGVVVKKLTRGQLAA